MLRDFKFLRSNSGRKEEAENVPVNPKDSSAIRIGSESRAPFNPIQDPVQQPKPEQEVGIRSRVEKTPTKAPKAKVSDPALPLRTPDRYGSRKRFGWAQKTEPISTTAGDLHEDGANYSTQVSRGGGGAGNGGLGSVTPRVTRTVGRAASGYSESNSTQTTPTKSVSKPPNSGFRNKADGSVGPRVGNFASLYKGIPISCGPSTVVNSVEVPHFDLKEDPSFWMDHNVQVLIRVRPLNSMERSLHGYNRCLKQESAQTISWIGQPESRFTFDHVACETVDQEMLFRMAGLPMVENCLSGYNSCMFAYGQTGSGKTHTMLGEIDDLETKPSPHRGMTPRIFEFLFARIQAEEEIRRDEKLKYNCKCSFLEIYNEQITDLLDPSSTNLLLREDVKQGVYVENLSEFEVYTVSDILRLLIQGSSNRRVAATNMNRESSRSHSVFTCVIESRWEKDSTTNLRFARLNLVDLAGSERQKSSGAEGERLKEAANINKSLSTLGHVIMVLVDMAHGKLKHVPYRDSRLTFLLQDSLGGNSKTMIIANVSPSICCAAETLNTLKFAQRAKLIQNNAVVNEDATGNVMALQHQIRLLKEELSILKRHNVSRSLSFCSANFEDTHKVRKIDCSENVCDMDLECDDDFLEIETKGTVRLSTKQLKSLETTLVGALRREQMAEAALKQLEAEKEQLNRLVRQREEDTRGTKMMLRFREDKIQKMESLLSGSITVESYLQDENRALSEEIQLLKSKLDKNPEVTRFALENIRLLDQLRRFQEFYEEGEREILLDEVSKLRDQLLQFLDGHSKQHSNPNISMKPQETVCMDRDGDPLNMELKNTLHELEECRRSLNTCLEENAKLNRDIEDLHTMLNKLKSTPIDQNDCVALKVLNAVPIEEVEPKLDPRIKHAEEILNLQLELDIVNIILREERTSQEERVYFLNKDLHLANEEIFVISKQHDDASRQLEEAKSVIEALESQQLLSINELEDLRKLLSERELELRALKEQRTLKEFRDLSPSNCSNNYDSPLQGNLKRMHDSLEKAKRLNTWYQSDRAFQVSNEEEMDEVRRQVEAETAEVIVCMQEELGMLQQQVQNSHLKDMEMNKNVMILETELKEVREKLYMLNEDNGRLSKELEEKDGKVRTLSREWTLLSSEIEEVLSDGCEELDGASDQLNLISNSFPQKRIWLSEQVGRTVRIISEKEYLIEELRRCLEDANNKKNEVECMLKSMRGATLAITEAHEQECCEKEKEMLMLTTKLNAKSSRVEKLENRVKLLEDQIRKTSVCATVAFVVVDKLAEMNRSNEDALKCKNIQLSESEDLISTKVAILSDQETVIAEAEKKVHSLSGEVEELERTCADLRQELSEERECAFTIRQKLEDVEEKTILMAREKLAELKTGVSTLRSCMNTNVEHHTSSEGKDSQLSSKSSKGEGGGWIATETILDQNGNEQFVEDLTAGKPDMSECTLKVRKSMCANSTREDLKSERPSKAKAGSGRDVTILLLKKEIETALDSLKEVQAEMDKLREENKLMCKSEQQSRESMKYLRTQIINLHSTMKNLEKQSKVKLEAQDHKLEVCQQMVQEAGSQWCQTKEMMEMEFDDAKLVAAQKTAEVSCILPKFEEAQDIIKEADNMINKLMISNKTMKLEIKRLKKLEASLISDKDMLLNEVQSLQSINYLSSQRFAEVEDLLTSDITETKALVVELEGMLAGIQAHYNENFILLASDFQSVKSLLSNSSKLIRSSVEDIWSEIIVKDCAVSVLHLCHMGIFLETVTGLNAENGLLQHGICESSTLIADLRQHNVRSQRELEMCQILKGKLLADIKNSYDHISRREEEAGKLSTKVNTFEKQISELQFQEELMLQRSNYMGSQLAILMKELDLSNSNFGASLLKQEKFLKEKEEAFESQVECFMIEWCSKDFESLILASELEVMAKHKADMEREHITCCAMLEDFKKEVIFSKVDTLLKGQFLLDEEVKVACLQMEAQKERQHLLSLLNQSSLRVAQMNEEKKALEQEIMLLKDVSLLNDALKGELGEAKQTEMKLLCQVQALEAEYQKLREDLNTKEMNLEISAHQFSVLEQENQRLQNDILTLQTSSDGLQDVLEKKKAELSRLNCLETENESLKTEIEKLNTENSMALKHLEQKNSEFSSSLSRISVFDKENCRLQDEIFSLEIHIVNLETHLRAKNAELDELLTISSAKAKKCVDSVETLDSANNRSCNIIREEGFMIVDKMSQELCETGERISQFIEQVNCLECQAKELVSENFSLRAELLRKDDVLNGLLFDLSLLQESASNNKDHQDEIAEMESSLEALEDELSAKSCELEETMANSQMLETQLQEKRDIISALEQGLLEERESLKFLSHENLELRAQVEDALATRTSVEKELTEKQKITESLKMEVLEMSNALDQMNDSNESLRDNLNELANEKDLLHTEMLQLKEKFEGELARADEIEAIANEAQQIAELRKIYADDKEAEVKLLERSVEELERTVDVLENKVDIVKGEAERQRLYGEELELELHAVEHQMQNVENANADMKRFLGEKEKALQEARHNIQILEKELAEKDAEIAQFKAHISELNLHAEAQACEYKQKFKVLESMAEQVRPESHSTHATSSSSNKSEKHAAKPRGSGSPFKCIGLGMAQQIKSEKDEDLTAARVRIEELESLAFSRQKEIFALNARLAAAESMTHDVIRDLLGVKLDMTSYVSLLDNQQVQKITEKARLHSVESQEKEQEVAKLKKQLSEFIQERQGWLEEIDRKQAELIAVQIALEKLKQRDQLLKTENEMLKAENVNHKMRVMELEGEVDKLSGQQNLHQRIHHHAKIKEENHKLKVQNEELSNKLRRTEVILSRVKEELACFRASCGKNPCVDFDEEQRLGAKLKETEEEKLQLAQKLLGLCSSVLKAAGITKQSTHINPSAAEEALEQIKNKITSMDRELQDLKFKNKISSERIRLSQLMPQTSPLSSRKDENSQTPKRTSQQAPYFSALDR